MSLNEQSVSLLLDISNALDQTVHYKEQRIHAVYPQVLPTGKDWEIGEDLMDPFGMAFIASSETYIRFADSLVAFLITAGKNGIQRHECNLRWHFGLDHYHLNDIFHNYKTVEWLRHYWEGYRGVALAKSQEEAHNWAKNFLGYEELTLGDLPLIRSLDDYDATFITIADYIPNNLTSSEMTDDHHLRQASSSIGELIQDQSALIYTLLGGGDEEIMLYSTVDGYLRFAKGIVDLVLAVRYYRNNYALKNPLLSMDLRRFFDKDVSAYAMETVCFAETEAEFKQASKFFRLP